MTDPHLAEQLRRADPDRYLSVLYAPQEKRADLFALYAFNAEIASIRERIHEPMPGEIRLQWWRGVLAAGTTEAAGGHPLAAELIGAIRRHDLPSSAFDNYLEARVFDLYDDPMPSRHDLEGYCGETASAIIQLAALVLDRENAGKFAGVAGHAGCAQAIAGLLRLLPIHRARGQCYIPADVLAAVGAAPDILIAGTDREALQRIVAAMLALGREHLTAFHREAANLPQTLRPAFLPLALTGAYFEALSRKGGAAASEVADIPAWTRHWLVFKAASRGW